MRRGKGNVGKEGEVFDLVKGVTEEYEISFIKERKRRGNVIVVV